MMQQKIKKLFRTILPIPPALNKAIPPTDYVFVSQYFKNGGAERVINNYISALHRLRPELKITILTTDFDDNATWHDGIPKGVQFINLSDISASLPRRLRVRLLSDAINQLSPQTIHIVNSKVALDFVAGLDHATLAFRVFVSLFNSDFSPSGRLRTYYKELAPAGKNITKIFTDNANIISEAIESTGLKKSLFKIHYQPIKAQVQTPHILPRTGKIRILWASRITQQKRPDILKSIAQNLSKDEFSISVYGSFDHPFDKSYFADISTLSYRGTFSSFAAIPTKNFDLFLYTSQADGMPNILLEATAAGLPIIAPDVGGINELIRSDTGFLIKDPTDIPAFLDVLEGISSRRPDLRPKIRSAQALLSTQHSAKTFDSAVKSDIIDKI